MLATMSAKDKDNKSFQDKLKQFFSSNKKATVSNRRNDFMVTAEVEREISGDNTQLTHRLRAIQKLCDPVVHNRLDEVAITKLWKCTCDLLTDDQALETRQIAYNFLACVCRGQGERVGMLRAQLFSVIKSSAPLATDDVASRFELMQSLTENGKMLLYFELEFGPFLLDWMPLINDAGIMFDCLKLLVNLIKFNAAHLTEDVISGFVMKTYSVCCANSNEQEFVIACLDVLDAVIRYSTLPNEALATFIGMLCRTVSNEAYCPLSWRIMRNLLGTHLGHASLNIMCHALQDPLVADDPAILRGAVFYVNMALWGANKVPKLKIPPTTVLPSFLKALSCNHPYVVFEVILSIQLLINKHGHELYDPAWDTILNILQAVIVYTERSNKINVHDRIGEYMHEVLTTIEQLIERKHFNGSLPRVFQLIERTAAQRPEISVFRLINYLSTMVMPPRHEWLTNLNRLMERYFRNETRTSVRCRVIDILANVIKLNRAMYEEELMERVVIKHLQDIALDSDVTVRNVVANLLVSLALDCETKRCAELVEIIDKLLRRPFDVYTPSNLPPDTDLVDAIAAVNGLIKIFTVKIYRLPSAHAISIYKYLLNHLEMHYARPAILDTCPIIRSKIFETFLKIRANSRCNIGYPSEGGGGAIRYSPYLSVANIGGSLNNSPPNSPATTNTQSSLSSSSSATSSSGALTTSVAVTSTATIAACVVTAVSLKRAFQAVQVCLRDERDWEVFYMVCRDVPKVMENKSLILSRRGLNKLDTFAITVCNLVLTDVKVDSLTKLPAKFTKCDFHSHILPMLASLATYHSYLESNTQIKIIRCLFKCGFITRYSRQCITTLTTCTLEMCDVMVKMLPELLLELSKTSPTLHIAIPILEFLLTLTRIPDVFSSFVSEQYMSIVAISSPYTNPYKYDHYTVSLAHHVISVWFLKCRLPFRRELATFIRQWLLSNTRLDDRKTTTSLNEDSSNRKRSSSLTEQGSRGRRTTMGGGGGGVSVASSGAGGSTMRVVDRPALDDALSTFHTELTETCVDLLARYTYSPCSALPKRFPTAEFLLANGQSSTWLLKNNMVITITTSGCTQKALKNGLCEKCLTYCKFDKAPATNDDSKWSLNRSASGDDSHHSSRDKATPRQNSTDQQTSQGLTAAALLRSANQSQDNSTSAAAPSNILVSDATITNLPSLNAVSGEARLEQVLPNHLNSVDEPAKNICVCWCQGWAEIYIRRPTGDVSWVMRIQNHISTTHSTMEFPLNEMSTLYLSNLDLKIDRTASSSSNRSSSSKEEALRKVGSGTIGGLGANTLGSSTSTDVTSFDTTECASIFTDKSCVGDDVTYKNTTSGPINIPKSPVRYSSTRQNSRDSMMTDETTDDVYESDDVLKSRNPVRRSNSSPEMSASWKNPFLTQDKTSTISSCTSTSGMTLTCGMAASGNSSSALATVGDLSGADELLASESLGEIATSTQQKKVNKCNYTKDTRVSCEAIPEEILGLGTTPPSTDCTESVATHHTLKSFHSCPGPDATTSSATTCSSSTLLTHDNFQLALNTRTSTSSASSGASSSNEKLCSTVPSSPNILSTCNCGGVHHSVRLPLPWYAPLEDGSSTTTTTTTTMSSSTLKIRPRSLTTHAASTMVSSKPPQSPLTTTSSGDLNLAAGQTSPRFAHVKTNEMTRSVQNVSNLARFGSACTLDQNKPTTNFRGESHVEGVTTEAAAQFRNRGHTISEIKQSASSIAARMRRTNSPRAAKEVAKSGINPSFVFLQLYHSASFENSERPLLVQGQAAQRNLRNLDTITPYDTHKVGVIYVGLSQVNDPVAILKNVYGSTRYVKFIQKLGTLIKLQDVDRALYFLGGLDPNGADGRYAYIWHDDVMQMIFHIATMMPNQANDEKAVEKLKHIGNNFVTIVYNDSQQEYNMKTIKTQFDFVNIIIEPLDHKTNRVTVRSGEDRKELAEHIGHKDAKIISDQNLPILVQQLALHANLFSRISCSGQMRQSGGAHRPFACNWLERLRNIKRLRKILQQELSQEQDKSAAAGKSGGGGGGGGLKNTTDPPDLKAASVKRQTPATAQPTLQIDDFTHYT